MSEQERHEDESPDVERAPKTSRPPEADEGWELWTKVSLLIGAIGVIAWAVVFLRLGVASFYSYAFVIPALGVLSLPVTFWGLVKTMFNRPVFRRSRTVGFGLLLSVGFFCSTPYFAVPLSTEDFQSEHTYRLPFDGEWTVTAGGDSLETNYHATTPTYRWAFDFTKVVDGERFEGEGTELSDYYCYGEPVLAPVAGEVVRVKDGQKDNDVEEFDGRLDAQSVMGNHIVVRVDTNEYLFVAHMKEGSIAVETGEEVEVGQKVGECGNSGASRKPNVHVHLQNSKEFPISESLPMMFSGYVADGKPVDKGMPEGSADADGSFGQHVKNANSNSD